MTTFMQPPPASTFLAFHPQDNNIIAIGMEDSTIHIYNVRVDEVSVADSSSSLTIASYVVLWYMTREILTIYLGSGCYSFTF